MALFRQSGSGTDSGNSFYEKGKGNGYLNLNLSDKDGVTKTDDQSEEEAAEGPTQLQNGTGCAYQSDSVAHTNTQSGRRTLETGKWGSSFWKDCQPMYSEEWLSKNEDSDCKSEEKFGDNLSDLDRHGDSEGMKRVQTDVPADEMSSDDYYEQDGEDQSDSLPCNRETNHPIASTSRPYSRPDTAVNRTSRISKEKYCDGDAYDEEDYVDDADAAAADDEAEDEDDPDDADFEPDYEGTGGHTKKKDKDWNVDGSDEDDDDDDDDLDITEEDYVDSINVPRRGKLHKAGQNVKPARENNQNKLFSMHNQRKRGKTYIEDDLSEKDTEEDTDGEFDLRTKRMGDSRRNLVGHSSSANTIVSNNEIRTSSRSVRKVSYAESEESEEIDEGKTKKLQQKDEVEENDIDSIEKVLWHQPKGTAEDALRSDRSTEPTVFNPLLDSQPDWNQVEFYIKWKGRSYLHCQWKCLSDLQNLSGFKKVINYTKRVMEERKYRMTLSREETEVHDVSKEMELDLLKQYSQVERVFAHRLSPSGSDEATPEYLVKWQGLSYAEATWEKDVDIAFAQQAIDDYKAREDAMAIQGKTVDSQRKKSKASLRKLDAQPEWLKGGQLRDYQLEGLNFLVNSWRNDTNVILADEMGLGKTVQSVSMLGFLQHAQEIHGPFLVVVPLSTLSNWAKEFRKWLPEMNVVVYVGNCASREVCQQYEFFSDKRIGRQTKFNALLTTYEVLLKDKALFSKIKWSYLMVDEAHRLKNCEASLYTTLSEFSTKNKLLITGTPLQNSVEELWALLHFLDPEKFKNKDEFVVKYKNLSSFNEMELANLHKELRPHILRRVIKDVEKSLPPKIERILRVEMSPLQKQYYKWILERNFHDLNKGVRGNQVSLLNIVVELKKCCNHPFLFESADHGYGGDSDIHDSSKVERIVLSSGKLVILDKLLLRLRETNHRVLIFSQMVKMLDILAEYLSLRGFQFQRLDGSTRADLRHQAMEHFNAPGSEDFCFLLSTRAGGLGINLATADTVIIFDSDWNPQNDLQAMSRAHRIGQQEVVNIYRFVTSKSVEEDILERAKKKMVLDHLVIQKLNAEGRLEKKETKKGGSMFDKNELSAILRFGAEELFKEEKNDEESKKKLESLDIDEILERAEKVESRDAEGEQGNELLSAFKVANFGGGEDDGTFWSRWIQPENVAQAEDALAPRAARNKKSYAEDIHYEKSSKRKRGLMAQERASKRGNRTTDYSVHSLPMIEGAVAQVRGWSHGNLSKKDATLFTRAVKKFGNQSQISWIVAEVGGVIEAAPSHAQLELYEVLINGCEDAVSGNPGAKGILLDFFGVPVKAQELLDRVHELQLLAKHIKRYHDPVAQFRLMTHIRGAAWAKGCGWNQVDDARLLLGVHYYGFGNWEKIRLDTRLGLIRKIAPATLGNGETFLPRAPNLDQRASALLRKEFTAVGSKTSKVKPARSEVDTNLRVANTRSKEGLDRQITKANRESNKKYQKAEPSTKEEGEVSDSEHYSFKQFREEKWREWCADIMYDEMRTLKRLEKLQTTSEDLPKEKVLIKIRKYLQLIGRKIDQIIQKHRERYKPARLAMRLWNYVSTFSNLTGEKLAQIYSKLKQEQQAEAVLASSHSNGSHRGISTREIDPSESNPFNGTQRSRPYKRFLTESSEAFHKEQETGKSEAWKRRRRTDLEYYQQPLSNGSWIHDPNSAGILGMGPADGRYLSSDTVSRSRQTHFPSGQLR